MINHQPDVNMFAWLPAAELALVTNQLYGQMRIYLQPKSSSDPSSSARPTRLSLFFVPIPSPLLSSPPLPSSDPLHNGQPFPSSNAPSCLLYKPPSCPYPGNIRTTPQNLYPSRSYSRYTPCHCHCRHPQGDTFPRLSLEAVPPHRAMSGPPPRLFPSSTIFNALVSSFAQRRIRSSYV